MNAEEERYARQRLIPFWHQEALTAATVLVAGAGALGNEVIKNLALLGVGHLVILDSDRIEGSNLSRTVLFRPTDVGASKAQTAAAAARQLNPQIHTTVLDGDLRQMVGLGRLRRWTLALGCLDNQGARSLLNRMCLAAQVPYLDGAMWAMGGEVRAFLDAEGPCFDCTLSAEERNDLWRRYSCSGGFRPAEAAPPMPTTITTTAIIAGLLAQEAVRWLCGQPLESGSALVYHGPAGKLSRTTFTRDPRCPHHTPLEWATLRVLPSPAAELPARAVLVLAQADLEGPPTLDLGREVLLAFACSGCGRREERAQLVVLVDEAEARCPFCGDHRVAQMTSTVELDDPWADRPLAQLGVPDGEVLSVRGQTAVLRYVLPLQDEE